MPDQDHRRRRQSRALAERLWGLKVRIADLEQDRPGEEPERRIENVTEDGLEMSDTVSETTSTAFTLAYDDATRGYERNQYAPE